MKSSYVRFALVGFFAAGMASYAADTTPTTPVTQPSADATQPSTNPSVTINWDEAKDHVGATATVTGPVMGTHALDDQHALLLNIGKDYPDKSRFTIFVTGDNNTTPADDTYMGKTVTVTGEIKLYRNVPEVKVGVKDVIVKEATAK